MYSLYLLILCFSSILLTPVNTYVVLAANIDDFQSLAKKYVPKNLVRQIKAIVLGNGHKYYNEPSVDDEQVDRAVEYLDESQQDDPNEVNREFKARQQTVNRYQVNSAPKVTLEEQLVLSPIAPLVTPTVLTIDDIVEKVKQRLFQQILDKKVNARDLNAQANSQAGSAQTGGSLTYKYFPKKSFEVTEAKGKVYKPVPMKVINEQVQFEATYEDILDKDINPQIQYPGQYVQSKLVTDKSNTKNMSPKNNRFVNAQYEGGVKKVRFVKQVLVPANSNQGQSAYVPLSSMVQEPMYPQLHRQEEIHQSTVMKQLVLIQQQIEQLIRTTQQKDLKKKRPIQPTSSTVLEAPQLNIEAVEANFEILPNLTPEDHVELSKEESEANVISEETTIAPVVTEPSTKALTVPGAVKNVHSTEEHEVVQDSIGTVENDDEATKEKTPEETKDNVSNEAEDIKPDPETDEGKVDNARLRANTKVHTQEFGNSDAGEPIVAKTYNFDERNVKPVNLTLPVDSARKVMLF